MRIDAPIPASRRKDPETSHLAEDKYRGVLGKRRLQVLRLTRQYPDRTAGEMSVALYQRHGFGFLEAAKTPGKRLPELEKLGLVKRGEKRTCTDTGYLAATWCITEEGCDLLDLP